MSEAIKPPTDSADADNSPANVASDAPTDPLASLRAELHQALDRGDFYRVRALASVLPDLPNGTLYAPPSAT